MRQSGAGSYNNRDNERYNYDDGSREERGFGQRNLGHGFGQSPRENPREIR